MEGNADPNRLENSFETNIFWPKRENKIDCAL